MQMNTDIGMRILDQDLAELVRCGIVSEEAAMLKSFNRERLRKLIHGIRNVPVLSLVGS
jgi:Tfp pilus assembly ATPase PilU